MLVAHWPCATNMVTSVMPSTSSILWTKCASKRSKRATSSNILPFAKAVMNYAQDNGQRSDFLSTSGLSIIPPCSVLSWPSSNLYIMISFVIVNKVGLCISKSAKEFNTTDNVYILKSWAVIIVFLIRISRQPKSTWSKCEKQRRALAISISLIESLCADLITSENLPRACGEL